MKKISKAGHLAVLTANVIFGLNIVISRSLMPVHVSAMALTFFRMAGAFLLFFIASFFIRKEKIAPRDYFRLFLASMFGILLNQMSFVKGLSYTSPVDASLVVTTLPIIAMLISAAYLKEPITKLKVLGVLVGAAGALIIILQSHSTVSTPGNFKGNMLCFLSCLSYAIYLVFFKDLMGKYHPVTLMKWMFLYAAIFSLPLAFKDITVINYAELSTDVYLRLIYVVGAATFIAYLLIPIGVRELRPTTVSMYNYLQPLVASIVAICIGMDTFSFSKVLSGILIFSGVFIVTQSKSKADLEK